MTKREVNGVLWLDCDGPECDKSIMASNYEGSGFTLEVSANERGEQHRHYCKECREKFEKNLGV